MSSLNRVTMIGNLTRAAELKKLPSGQSVCRMSIASNRPIRDKNGEITGQEVCYIDVDVWGHLAENCSSNLDKGSMIFVEGRLKLDSWTDQEGNKRSKHSIIADKVLQIDRFARTDSHGASSHEGSSHGAPRSDFGPKKEMKAKNKGELNFKDSDAFEDDLPF